MREIKFRAWDTNRLKMVGNDYLEAHKYGLRLFRNDPEWADGFTMMQFTGLLDRNGKEIYEGDIVRMAPAFGSPGVVVWDGQYAKFQVIHPGIAIPSGLNSRETFYVIGNIHQHPEKLEPHEMEDFIPR